MSDTTTHRPLEWSDTLLEGERVRFNEAKKAVDSLGEGWRLPTVDELQTILDRTRHSPAANLETHPDTKPAPYWTSSPCAWSSSARWVVSFYGGVVDVNGGACTACVRACRVVELPQQ